MSAAESAPIDNAPAEKPAKETPTVPSGPVDKRIYIGGLHPSTTEDQIVERFSKFGQVSNVTIAKNTDNECRGFAHMTIHTEPKKWDTCLGVYNGAKWRGQELKLEEAKMDWQERKRLRQEKILEQEEKKKKRLLRWNDSDGFHAKDMTPVTDNNMGTRKGWKRGRYGRAISVMRLKKDDGTKFVFEPTHYKNNLTKLYNIGVRMKPVSQLITKIDDESSDSEDDWPSYSNKARDQEEEDEEERGEAHTTKSMTDDEKRRAAMEKMFEEQRVKKEMISKALAGQAEGQHHTTFDNDDDDIQVDDAFKMDVDQAEQEPTKPMDAKKWMFDSDEDDDSDEELDIKINPVLEGEAGRKRLELQKKFKGDDRFKLGEDFIDEEEKNVQSKDLGDDITQGLDAEKDQALDVLRAMFGDDKVNFKPKHQSNTWASSDRFDPDADDSSKYLAEAAVEKDTTVKNQDIDGDDSDDDDADFFAQPRKAESAVPVVSTEKHFEVNTNLKPLFGDAEEAPFTLFGGDSDDNAQQGASFGADKSKPLFGHAHDDDEMSPSFTPKKAEGRLGLGVLFFFHLDDPALMKKSCYAYDSEGVFQEKTEERDSYENKWRTQRPVIKEILKKRQKNAIKNQKRRSTKYLK
ncbi:conserved hypothetical protein [Mucor ambiguus]|uniref:RRM domain-containing protein n=1 Tax=Mucor ambiguus TaxID=91626 RepID=A0A0C9LQH0_9FUNG|nr:conserved hypothetical protein [Mucor ambiguus]